MDSINMDSINNDATCTALRACGVQMNGATVKGAGHYVQDLQYPYLLWVLRNYSANKDVARESLRVNITSIGNRKLVYATT